MSEAQSVPEDARGGELTPTLDEDAAVNILTHGDPLRSWATLPAVLDDEVRVTFEEDRIQTEFVDPANVSMLTLNAPAVGFEHYQADEEVTLGLNLDTFQKTLRWARKRGNGDPVALSVYTDPLRIRVEIVREDQQMQRQTEWFAIDPDRLRQGPERPDLDLPLKAYPGVSALKDAVAAIAESEDYAYVTEDDGAFILASQAGGDTTPSHEKPELGSSPENVVRMPNAVEQISEGGASSVFSIDYLRDITTALKRSKATTVRVMWGEEYPVRIGFQHEDWGFNGEFLLAPRITPEDD